VLERQAEVRQRRDQIREDLRRLGALTTGL
jgi:hypothetical protein